MKKIDLTGKRFGRWTVLKESLKRDSHNHILWECLCDCGNTGLIPGGNLREYLSTSCGCFKLEAQTKHGHARNGKLSPTYTSWHKMMDRCYNKASDGYHMYGFMGISVCERWHSFKNFLEDMGERPKGLTLERFSNFGNYEPSNCLWATRKEQANNRG